MTLIDRIRQIAMEIMVEGKVTPTHLMYECMNQMTDGDVYGKYQTDLVDVAEKIEFLCEKEFNK